MPTLRIRVYNVLFGDALLLTIPDEDEHGQPVTLQVLFDVGKALAGPGGDESVFQPVLNDFGGSSAAPPSTST